jgi:hypothetical protein
VVALTQLRLSFAATFSIFLLLTISLAKPEQMPDTADETMRAIITRRYAVLWQQLS